MYMYINHIKYVMDNIFTVGLLHLIPLKRFEILKFGIVLHIHRGINNV